MKIGMNTSMIDIFRNGIIGTRTMNKCRKLGIERVADLASIDNKHGGIERKFGPDRKTTKAFLAILCMVA